MKHKINRRESAALINSLSSGVVPRIGLRHIAVGRLKEVEAYLNDLETIEEGGAAFRFISGRYGSGKSFLIQLIRNNAMDRNFVVMDADLSPERRFSGSKGQGLATYRELIQSLSTRTNPDGHGLDAVLQKWINAIQRQVLLETGLAPNDPELINQVGRKIHEDLAVLSELSCGFSFATVVSAYWNAVKTDDEVLKQQALKWLRGEYHTKTEARKELGVDTIINDQNWYDFLKLFAQFIHLAGYKGLVIFIDEGVNLYKIVNKQARNNNYEKVLTMFNDMMQGKAKYIGMTLAGTPEFIYNERKGLFSYEALRSRLADSRFITDNFNDFTMPILKLEQLSNEELYVLLERILEVHQSYYKHEFQLTPEELSKFLSVLYNRIGTDELLTTREVCREFISLLNYLVQNPDTEALTYLNSLESPISSDEEYNDFDTDEFFDDFIL